MGFQHILLSTGLSVFLPVLETNLCLFSVSPDEIVGLRFGGPVVVNQISTEYLLLVSREIAVLKELTC